MKALGTVTAFALVVLLAAGQAHAQVEPSEQFHLELETVPRAAMFVPMGIGQFANRDYALGGVFLAVESVSLTAAIASWTLGESLYPPPRLYSDGGFIALRVTNIVAWSIFGLASLGGILQANVAYQPSRVRIRPGGVPVAAIVWIPGGASVVVGAAF